MQQFLIEGFEVVMRTSDGMNEPSVAVFRTSIMADACAEQSKLHCRVRPYKQCITVFDTVLEFDIENNRVLVDRALAKLNPEERAALGFPDAE